MEDNGHRLSWVMALFTADLQNLVCLLEEINIIYSSQDAAINPTTYLSLSQKETPEPIAFTSQKSYPTLLSDLALSPCSVSVSQFSLQDLDLLTIPEYIMLVYRVGETRKLKVATTANTWETFA